MIQPALLRFVWGRLTTPFLLVLISIFSGCSVDQVSVAPPASESGSSSSTQRGGVPEEFPRNGVVPPASGSTPNGSARGKVPSAEPYRAPAYTPYWSAPTLSALFRRLPGLRPRNTPPPEATLGTPVVSEVVNSRESPPGNATPGANATTGTKASVATGGGMPRTQRGLKARPGLNNSPLKHTAPRTRQGHTPKDFHMMYPYLEGVASWYGPGFHGKDTANGETYNQNGLTAAHPNLPLGTVIKVRNLLNDRVVWVRVNDRGPYAKGRILDLSKAAARRLDMLKNGTAPVHIQVLRWPSNFQAKGGLLPYTQYVVQVAAYPDQDTAEVELERIQQRFPWADFALDWRKGNKLSVIAGPFDNEAGAVKIAKRLQRNGVTSLTRRYRK